MNSPRSRRAAVAVVAVALFAAAVAPSRAGPDDPPVPPPPEVALASIVADDASKHVNHLAGAKLEGRASGFAGADAAGKYLVEQLRSFGVEPAGDPTGPGAAVTGSPAAEGAAAAVTLGYEQSFEIRLIPFPGQGPSDEAKGQTGTTFNVCGVVRGSDEKLHEEHVVLSAHYDHVGKRGKKKVFHGADDNASGTSALLEVAQAFALKDAPRPKRSILILFFSAEERGLLGSLHYTQKPTVPLERIVCDLNIDMVGRNKPKEMDVYGNGTSPDLDSAHLAAAARSGLKFTPRIGSIFLRSDQKNFYEKGIPCLFWTSGLHKDYHTVNDLAARIDDGKVARAATHAYLTAWEIANRPERPRFQKMDANASAGPLGAVLDMVPPEDVPQAKLAAGAGIVLIRSVMDGTAASEAKLQPGDHILGVSDDPLPEDDPVGAVEKAMEAAKGKKETLRILRGTKVLRVTVKL